ncbi:MAG: helix-turn-helix domain-containing protein, partial [Eggerthellaceae bacterium]|nr:helix-turn-helix domain-containing protein [Eggerthellaceae bacterium]
MYTTKEAAERLGVSVRRVNALIASGEIQAKKFGRAWMIDEASVSKRSEETHRAGRPKMGERHASNLQRYTLMSKRRPVLSFVYNKRT